MATKTDNHFVGIVAAIEEAVESQGGLPQKWESNTALILRNDSEGEFAFVRADALELVFDNEQIKLLKKHRLIDLSAVETIHRGGRRRECIRLAMNPLRKRAKDVEVSESKVAVLAHKTRLMEKQVKLAREESLADEAMAETINGMGEFFKANIDKFGDIAKKTLLPKKISRSDARRQGKELAGVPTLMLSDLHWGEVVDPAQVEYFNEYNLATAHRRLDRIFDQAINTLITRQPDVYYDAIVLILGGDLFSGNIHDELRITNEVPMLEAVNDLLLKLFEKVLLLASHFPHVYIPVVVGNHGRMDKKPSCKNKVKDNYDWQVAVLLEHLVKNAMGPNCNVEFAISEATDAMYSIYNTTYNLTHGDQFKTAGGVGGIFPGLMKTDYRKRKRALHSGRAGYDYLVMGHWHQYGTLDGIIVNGSLKGTDEYTYNSNFDVQVPIQALWITHPQYGITQHIPLYGDEPYQQAEAAPITSMVNLTAEERRRFFRAA